MPRLPRPSWDSYFLEIASVIAGRSTCLRRQVGAVLVKDKRLLATGYNGAPTGLEHCLETGCLRQEKIFLRESVTSYAGGCTLNKMPSFRPLCMEFPSRARIFTAHIILALYVQKC